MQTHALILMLAAVLAAPPAAAQAPRVVDLPTRDGVTQRFIALAPESRAPR